jgi:DnaJ family protein C protein 11
MGVPTLVRSPPRLLTRVVPAPPPLPLPTAQAASRSFNKLNEAYEVLSDKNRRRIYDVYGMAGLDAGLEVGRKHKSLAEITEEFERARAKEARKRLEAKLNFRGAYGFSFSAAHLFNEDIARKRRMFAARRGVVASPFLDLNGMDYNSVFDVPVTDDTTAYVGAQGQMSRGMGAGGLILGLRRAVSPHTSWEAAAVMGSMQSAATLAVQRQLSEHSAGTLTYSYSNAQGGLGLEVGVQRQLSAHSKGHLTWNVGPVGGMSTGMQRAKGKNSWKFDFSVGPASTGITGFLARRLSKKSTFRLGFRLGTMAIDVDVGCARKVNHESSIGMSVSIGLRGVHIKIRFNHSGQRFQFPILITPFVTPTRVLASLTIPTALVLVTKRYVVKPAALRARAAEQRELRRRHARAVAADKTESAEAQALLKSQADKRAAKERERGGLVIEAAAYGHFPRRSRPRPGDPIVEGFGAEAKEEGGSTAAANGSVDDGGADGGYVPWMDVTVATQFMVFDSHLDINEGTHKPSMLGFCDPCPGEEACLRVRYRHRGRMHEVTVGAEDALSAPNPSHELPAEWQTPPPPPK